MVEQDREWFAKLFRDTAEIYGKILSNNMLNLYWDDLQQFDFVDIRNALASHRRDTKHGKFMPTSADLIKKIKDERSESGKGSSNHFCMVMENAKQCGERKNLILVSNANEPVAVHWCLKHYEQKRKKSDIEFEIDRRADLFRELQKKSGVSWPEFFRQYCGYDFKDAAKKLSGVA